MTTLTRSVPQGEAPYGSHNPASLRSTNDHAFNAVLPSFTEK